MAINTTTTVEHKHADYKIDNNSFIPDKVHADIKSEESSYFKGLFGPKFMKNGTKIIPWAESYPQDKYKIKGKELDIADPASIPSLNKGIQYKESISDGNSNKIKVLDEVSAGTCKSFSYSRYEYTVETPENKKFGIKRINNDGKTEHFTSSHFQNGITPTRLIMLLQGAGGGGGGGDWGFGGQPGAGGGAGGFWYGVVRLECGDRIDVNLGSGGAGGEANPNDANRNRGKTGETSSIIYTPCACPDCAKKNKKSISIYVHGGTGGDGGESGDNHKGGVRGQVEIKYTDSNTIIDKYDNTNNSVWTILASNWENVAWPNGQVFTGKYGTGGTHFNNGDPHEAIILYPYLLSQFNNVTPKDLAIKTIFLKTRAGGTAQRGGGGASSIVNFGGTGGKNGAGNGNGTQGGWGAGGGGGADTGHWDLVAGSGGLGGEALLLVW